MSAHGRALSKSALAHAVRTHERTFLFCDAAHNPAWLCAALRESGIPDVEVAVGERPSYPDAQVLSGAPEEIEGRAFDPLSFARILNPHSRSARRPSAFRTARSSAEGRR